MSSRNKFAAYPRLNPLGIGKNISAADLIDEAFLAYNGGRLREAAKLLPRECWRPIFDGVAIALTVGAACWLFVDATRSIVEAKRPQEEPAGGKELV